MAALKGLYIFIAATSKSHVMRVFYGTLGKVLLRITTFKLRIIHMAATFFAHCQRRVYSILKDKLSYQPNCVMYVSVHC
jgi:hypothetical protein